MSHPVRTVGPNVVSLLGFPIAEVPEFPDKGGAKVAFRANMRDTNEQPTEVSGTRTVFGLVLHRYLAPPGGQPTWCRWTISEPTTGGAVAWGRTRRDALDDLALRVAFYGGEKAFQEVLQRAIAQHMEAAGAGAVPRVRSAGGWA
jgi:hypothetical protein